MILARAHARGHALGHAHANATEYSTYEEACVFEGHWRCRQKQFRMSQDELIPEDCPREAREKAACRMDVHLSHLSSVRFVRIEVWICAL